MDKAKENICSIYSLNKAFKKRKSCRMWKPSVMDYYLHMTRYNYILHKQLMTDTYKIKPCYSFNICDPKPRSIEAPHLSDGIIQSSVNNNYLCDKLSTVFLDENCACQKGKGTDYARKLLKNQLKRFYDKHGLNGVAWKIDLKSFFASIDGNALHELNVKYVENSWIISMIEKWGVEPCNKGLGLGAETNQTESCLMLHPIDTFFKTVLSCRYYCRYQDDIIAIFPSIEDVHKAEFKLIKELDEYKLKLNINKTQIYSLTDRIPFLGFRFTLLHTGKILMRLKNESVKREKRKLNRQLELNIPTKDVLMSFMSWRATALKGNNYHILKRMENYAMEVLRVNRREEMQRELALARLEELNATIEYMALMSDVDINKTSDNGDSKETTV